MMLIDVAYEIGELVYLRTDPDQRVRVVFGINIRPNSTITYCLGCGPATTEHYDFEMSAEPDAVMKTNS